MAACLKERYDSPACERLIGWRPTEDDPWWLTEALGWVAMYRAIQESPGRTGDIYRSLLKWEMETMRYPPWRLYGIYKRWERALEAERREKK